MQKVLPGLEPLKAKEIQNLLLRDPDLRIIRNRQLIVRYRQHFAEGGLRVSLVGGVYDMLHDAHMMYLLDAMSRADISIVALDSDELARKRKNDPLRPFDNEEDRARNLVLASLAHIVTFRDAQEHPYDLIRLLRPDVLVTSKGTKDVGDEDRENLKEFCGEIVALEPKNSKSTTAKMFRILSAGAREIEAEIRRETEDFGRRIQAIFTRRRNGGDNG